MRLRNLVFSLLSNVRVAHRLFECKNRVFSLGNSSKRFYDDVNTQRFLNDENRNDLLRCISKLILQNV